MFAVPSILVLSPFEFPDVRLVELFSRASALGVLDVGRDPKVAEDALSTLARRVPEGFGVRVPDDVARESFRLPEAARVVVVAGSRVAEGWGDRLVLAQVTSVDEAREAVGSGAFGIVAKGNEAGGRVGDETSFVLVQRIRKAFPEIPVWVQGGIGLHGAAACLAAGARGVVLDSQVALLDGVGTAPAVRRALASMDGSETVVVAGARIYSRPNAFTPAADTTLAELSLRFGATDPAKDVLALGQDAAFAKPFAHRFGTARRLVRAFHRAMEGHGRMARAVAPLARGNAFAREHRIEFPIAQGPMTRVSDVPEFAEAVARAGALPFLALSLLREDEARRLLEASKTSLEGRPWGVGILGFLPADVREEQLAVVREARPDVAIIAGGRPAQAKALEDVGIKTYLHVPSPGLLDLFLKDGARRFVFEGRECGGHVGPRSSLVLWDMAVERLLTESAPEELHVLFAGGIHDEVSAAMVATLAAPLAARGAKIGVVLGTAYLFTEEAVTTGAIGAVFQEEALKCERTALVETAPGHATRCADSEFVRIFERERARLMAEGREPHEVWEALEQLNLGRLRIASKALRREGRALVTVSEDEQRREGMFMIGQVAALRAARCSMLELHAAVSDGSMAFLARSTPFVAPPSRERGTDVAIVGMACIFPDAPDLGAYWRNIVTGHNAVREVPKDRWNPDLYFDPQGAGEKTPSKWGGFLPPTCFDPGAFGIPPRSLAAIDPVQLLSLEVARRALDDAGYGGDKWFDRDRTSVIFGAEAGTDLANAYGFRASYPQYLGPLPEALDAHLPRLTEDSFPGVLANVIAGRIANRLDLGGVNYTVDAACASSLAAVELACKELAAGTSHMVIAGGADLHNGIHDYLMFASVHALSPTGQCRTFDASADGIALGEGVAAVVLKRVEDAERDGDRVYAVLKGVGGSSDGKSLGLTAPRREGQLRALETAYERAGVSPADVGLVEAHGTGTVVGDRTELAALTEFFGDAGALPGTCTLGSVKSQVGHTKCAAGLAGLIKAALAIHHRVLPPTKNVVTPNPAYEGSRSPFVFRDTAAPWVASRCAAGVSAFGFGGTNFHAVLTEALAPTVESTALVDWPAELFLFRGRSDAEVRESAVALGAWLAALAAAGEPPLKLRDVARTVARARGDAPVQAAFVVSSWAELRDKTSCLAEGRTAAGLFRAEGAVSGRVAMLFPGQGSQRPGQLSDLFVVFPFLHDVLRSGDKYLARLFPGAALTPEGRAEQLRALTDTRVAQPVLGLAGLAMARLLARFGVVPDVVGGHSYGEVVALTVAGALRADDLCTLSEERALAILGAIVDEPGTMAAVRASEERIAELLGGEVEVCFANLNAPDQTVLAGRRRDIEAACAKLATAGLAARVIPVACAFHSPLVAGAEAAFRRALDRVPVQCPTVPTYANATAAPYPHDPMAVRRELAAQLARPVRFRDQVEAMYRAGARVFVEAGPGRVLTDLVGRILGDEPHLAVACETSGAHGLTGFLLTLARLAVAGVPVDAGALFEGRDAKVFDLFAPPDLAPPKAAWIVDGHRARPVHGDLPEFAMKTVSEPFTLVASPALPGDRDAVVLEYLRGMRELVDGQKQVLLRYLGDGAPPASLEAWDPRAARAALPAAATLEGAGVGPGRGAHAANMNGAATNGGATNGTAHPESAALPSAPTTMTSGLSPKEALLLTVSERTGYPPEMLDLDLDLEGDLGIDSIKRIEILGTLSERLGLKLVGGGAAKDAVEELVGMKTLRGIAQLLEAKLGTPSMPAAPAVAAAPSATEPPPSADAPPVSRFVPEVEVAPVAAAEGPVSVEGRTFAITADGRGVARKLAALLEARGARAEVIESDELSGDFDGVLHLQPLAEGSASTLRTLFALAKQAAEKDAKWIVATTGLGGHFGLRAAAGGPKAAAVGGVSGMLKSIAKEWPDLRVRAIDLHPDDDPEQLARHIFAELTAEDGFVEVGYEGGVRQTVSIVPKPTSPSSVPPALTLDESSVVLVTGGARGITARVAVAMAQRFRCRLELVGRSPLPEDDEDPALRSATDEVSLRRALLERANGAGPTSPAAIKATVQSILAAREIRATLDEIRAAGSEVRYHAVDVRDPVAFGAVIDEIRARHGRVDGVIHGAGLIEDKLLMHKTRDSFDRVFDTKVRGAFTLAEKLASEVRFFVLFSSVSGAFGNRGQTDYAAANDALDKLAHHLHGTVPGRVLSINWGPWQGVGMVRPELEREYARRGIGLITPSLGIDRFFEELLATAEPQVILTASAPSALS